jgi:two-component system NtrC family sensor kinase
MPELICRPQQLSAVFSNLLNNALEASEPGSAVRVTTRTADSRIEVLIEDSGRGLDDRELATIFDPDFKVTQGRVATGNWSLFSSRQIVREHGGDIQIDSRKGQGTWVRVLLPLEAQTQT